jgi:hypothetical protein
MARPNLPAQLKAVKMTEFLQMEDLTHPDGPDVGGALFLPLPPDAGLDLLDHARRVVLGYLDEITSWKAIIHGPRAGEVHKEMRIVLRRLGEITKGIQRVSQAMEDETMREAVVDQPVRVAEEAPIATGDPNSSDDEIPF